MKRIVVVLFTLIVKSAFAQTQADMNHQVYAEYQKADNELNEVYKQLLVEYKTDTVYINNLKASQRIWINFRDAELHMKYPEREAGYYGSLHPICSTSYLAELTKERTKKLREWLAGAEEGDICSGSVRIKE
ncbi:lysozyme inhibitor LprI family protein [Pontibacter silvestris]|uniref:Lysozyme inhibitor LprI family protein n=1 Tax=Pontibacter silvestris TaxID=2305183 RepID=A0ABW4WW11_9BACT|nr:lysozyme inhibitor LprI family protein [Pontibacter silvestris]MCC9137413.1 DUF1311 domain-containing protein [Pontibacter silvestris]